MIRLQQKIDTLQEVASKNHLLESQLADVGAAKARLQAAINQVEQERLAAIESLQNLEIERAALAAKLAVHESLNAKVGAHLREPDSAK